MDEKKSLEMEQDEINKVQILPSAISLLKDAFAFSKQNWDLTMVLAAPFLISTLSAFYSKSVYLSDLGNLIATIVYIFVYVAILYAVFNRKENPNSLEEEFSWAGKNFFSVALVYILTTLVVWGGAVLFIIPGIILSILLYLSLYAYVVDQKKGMEALLISHNLVKGNWWLLFGRLFVAGLIMLLALATLGVVVSGLAELVFTGAAYGLFNSLMVHVVGGFMTVMSMHIGLEIYKKLKLYRDSSPLEKPLENTRNYKILLIIGLIAPVLIIWALLAYSSVADYKEGEMYCGEKPLDIMLFNDKDCTFSQEDRLDAKQRAAELRG